MIFDFLTEKELWVLSVAPAVILTIVELWLIRHNPRPLLQLLGNIVPGFKSVDLHSSSVVYLRMDSTSDVIEMGKKVVKDLAAEAQEMATTALTAAQGTDVEAGGRREAAHARRRMTRFGTTTREVSVQLRHLLEAAALPMLFLNFLLFDGAFIHRGGGDTYPLLECQDPDHYVCFYITEDYSLWHWPTYRDMQCGALTRAAVSGHSAFPYRAPKDAKFYKCYSSLITLRDLVGVVGDNIALSTILSLVVLRTYLHVNMVVGTESMSAIRRQQGWTLLWAALVYVPLLAASILLAPARYAKAENLFLPGAFLVLLIWSAHLYQMLCQRMEELKEDQLIGL